MSLNHTLHAMRELVEQQPLFKTCTIKAYKNLSRDDMKFLGNELAAVQGLQRPNDWYEVFMQLRELYVDAKGDTDDYTARVKNRKYTCCFPLPFP